MILSSKNKIETAWKIIKKKKVKQIKKLGVQSLKTDKHVMIPNTFNKCFISIADSIIRSVWSGTNDRENKPNFIQYLFNCFKHPFPNIKWFYTSTSEIENTIKSLKTKNCCGYNELPIKIRKIGAPFIISPLICIFNKSRFSGVSLID